MPKKMSIADIFKIGILSVLAGFIIIIFASLFNFNLPFLMIAGSNSKYESKYLRTWDSLIIIAVEGDIKEKSKEDKISIEEAALETAISYKVVLPSRLHLLPKAYDNLKEKKIKSFKPKNPKDVELFKKFYTAAKQDIEKTGKISEKTLAMIK